MCLFSIVCAYYTMCVYVSVCVHLCVYVSVYLCVGISVHGTWERGDMLISFPYSTKSLRLST